MKPCRPPPHRGDPSPIDVLLAPDFQLPETPIFHCLPQVQSTTTPIYTQMKHGEAGGWPKGSNDPPPTGAEDVYKIWRSPCACRFRVEAREAIDEQQKPASGVRWMARRGDEAPAAHCMHSQPNLSLWWSSRPVTQWAASDTSRRQCGGKPQAGPGQPGTPAARRRPGRRHVPQDC